MKSAPQFVPSGFIAVPCGILDMAGNEKAAVVTKVVLFNRRFDLHHMRKTYYDLLRAWPFLAGRLHKGSGRVGELWTLHIPTTEKLEELIQADQRGHFSFKRSVPMFSSAQRSTESLYDVMPFANIAAHPEKLSQESPSIAVIDRLAMLDDFTSPKGVKSMDQYFSRDAPIFTVHVTDFKDGAGFTWTVPHACFDGAGAKYALEAYLDLLRGDSMPPVPPLGYDPFLQYAPSQSSSAPSSLADKQANGSCLPSASKNLKLATAPAPQQPEHWRILSLLHLLLLCWNIASDYFFDRPERTMRRVMIYVPPKFIHGLKEQVQTDIKAEHGVEKLNSLRLSRGNALHAWVLKNELARRVDVKPNRVTTHGTLANMRYRLPKGLSSIHPGYTANCLVPIVAPVTTTKALAARSMGSIAYDIRQSLLEQSTPEKFEQYVKWQAWRGTPTALGGGLEKTGMAVFFPSTSRFTLVTDWTKFGLWDLDWSGALAKPELVPCSPDSTKEGSDSSSTMTAAPAADKCGMLALIGDAHLSLHQRNGWILVGGRDGGCWVLGNMSDEERQHPRGWGRYDTIATTAEA